jgi:hypothetical protein
MEQVHITISEDEALVLFELLERWGDTENLSFDHPAEYIALMKISAQIDKSITTMFNSGYSILLESARQSVGEGFEGEVPGMTKFASDL